MDSMLLLAQSEEDVAAMAFMTVMIVIVLVAVTVGIAIQVFICWLTVKCVESIPPQHRSIEPGSVWLLLIPCFALIWNFFVYPKLSESFQRHFASIGNHRNGDCGAQIAQWYCLCIVFQCIPIVNYIAGPASLILLIIMLVKFWDLKGQAERGAVGGPLNPAYATPAAMPRKFDPKNPYA